MGVLIIRALLPGTRSQGLVQIPHIWVPGTLRNGENLYRTHTEALMKSRTSTPAGLKQLAWHLDICKGGGPAEIVCILA